MPAPTHHSRPPRVLSRRAVLGGVGALVLSGCSVNNPFDDEQQPAGKALPDLAPDVAVAVQAVIAMRAAAAFVEAVGNRHPRLATALSGLGEMHAAHLQRLTDAVPDRVRLPPTTAPVVVPARPATARREVATREGQLRSRLTGFAVQAESGAFARLLGSCAASISQHLAVLP